MLAHVCYGGQFGDEERQFEAPPQQKDAASSGSWTEDR
jgi:hypothetical protein